MTVMLDRSQRDCVHLYLLAELAEMAELTVALHSDDVDTAQRWRRWIEEDWRLLDEIGWEKAGTEEVYPITLPASEIREVFGRLHDLARDSIKNAMGEFANRVLKEAFTAVETAELVLQELPGGTR
jgi:hypothetical protein